MVGNSTYYIIVNLNLSINEFLLKIKIKKITFYISFDFGITMYEQELLCDISSLILLRRITPCRIPINHINDPLFSLIGYISNK